MKSSSSFISGYWICISFWKTWTNKLFCKLPTWFITLHLICQDNQTFFLKGIDKPLIQSNKWTRSLFLKPYANTFFVWTIFVIIARLLESFLEIKHPPLCPDFLGTHFIQILSRFYLDDIWIKSALSTSQFRNPKELVIIGIFYEF